MLHMQSGHMLLILLASLQLISIHTFSSLLCQSVCKFKSRLISRSPPWAKINPNYEITAKHTHNAIKNYRLDIFPQVLPRVRPPLYINATQKQCGNSSGTSAHRLAFQFQLKLIQSPISYSIHCTTWCL